MLLTPCSDECGSSESNNYIIKFFDDLPILSLSGTVVVLDPNADTKLLREGKTTLLLGKRGKPKDSIRKPQTHRNLTVTPKRAFPGTLLCPSGWFFIQHPGRDEGCRTEGQLLTQHPPSSSCLLGHQGQLRFPQGRL